MITLDKARQMIAAAESKAQDIEQPMNIAVVDDGGNLVSHARMDGAWIGSIDISINTAYTARLFDMPTEDHAPLAQSGGPRFGIDSTNGGRVVIFAGGIPVTDDGRDVGAVGGSGGTVEQHQEVAEAGAAAY